MSSACPQPGCGVEYDLSNHPLGTEFNCRRCGQPLSVQADGLHLAAGARASSDASGSSLGKYGAQASQVWDRMQRVADPATWLFGTGAFLALFALFFPIMDGAKVSRLESMIVAGDMRQAQTDEIASRATATSGDKTNAEDAKKKWLKTKDALEENLISAELSRRGWTYWYTCLTLLGFMLLLLGSFGFLDPAQPPMRRILGCIVLTATVLVVLNALARTSFRLEIGPR